jgi:hypothetical protein
MGIEGKQDVYFPLTSNIYQDLRVCLGAYSPSNRGLGSSSIENSDEEVFAYLLTSFLFSEFNTDLAHVTETDNQGHSDKYSLLSKLFSWDMHSLRCTPSITKEELIKFTEENVVRKFALDTIKSVLGVL